MESGDQGKILVSSLRARLDDVRQRLAGVAATRVLFVVWQQPLISVGRDAFLSDALRPAGAESIIRSRQDWPHVSMEEVVRLQPDYLVFAAADTTEDTLSMEATLAGLRDAPGLARPEGHAGESHRDCERRDQSSVAAACGCD